MKELAQKNLKKLSENPYPGRGFVIGLTKNGDAVIAYWTMGRSPSSRNRILIEDNGIVKTALADPSLDAGGNLELLLYDAIAKIEDSVYVVSNGKQTTAIVEDSDLYTPIDTMFDDEWKYEPDGPNFTPRITGICGFEDDEKAMGQIILLRKTPEEGSMECDRNVFHYGRLYPEIGHCVTTYEGDGKPLPPFSGEPFILPLTGDIEEIANTLWNALNEDNRVSLAVKVIHADGTFEPARIINKYGKK